MKVLSLFDGMANGMLAFHKLGIEVDRYVAYEIDKYAIKVSCHNFPNIEQRGDVFEADFTEFEGFDFVVGGSPCTYWSIVKKEGRETEASGMGWELFQQYVRAIREAKPKFFIYENNKSMSQAIRESITVAFGFEPICINSALVSAQNRQRLYWVGIRNEDGAYRKANIEQPEDLGILLKDILESGEDLTSNDKSFCLTARYQGAIPWNAIERSQKTMVAEPIVLNTTVDGKAQCIRATYYKDGIRKMIGNDVDKRTCVAEPVNVTEDGKSQTIKAQYYKNSIANFVCYSGTYGATGVAEPVAGRMVGRRINEDGHRDDYNEDIECVQRFEVNNNPQKTNCLSTVQKDNVVAQPIEYKVRKNCEVVITDKSIRNARNDAKKSSAQESFVYFDDVKVNASTTAHVPMTIIDSSGKESPVYEVKDGLITINGKQYPIKLSDGYYIIRKLTVTECKRLQTVPDDYDMSVISNTQAYKCLGNGWTVDVITHLITSALEDSNHENITG